VFTTSQPYVFVCLFVQLLSFDSRRKQRNPACIPEYTVFEFPENCFHVSINFLCVTIRDVEVVEYFLHPFSASYKVSRFRVCFRFQLPLSHPCTTFYEQCFRFRLLKKSNTSEFASASSFFLQSASASTKI